MKSEVIKKASTVQDAIQAGLDELDVERDQVEVKVLDSGGGWLSWLGLGKAVAAGDIDLDGKLDIVFSCGMAKEDKHGVMWIAYDQRPTESRWTGHTISGPLGVKFDLVKLIDLDGDGDLDVLTCEEVDNLGVFWYENPTRS